MTPRILGCVAALAAALATADASARTVLTFDADLQIFDLNGIVNPLPAVPLTARVTAIYEETSPHDITLGGGPGGSPVGLVYNNATELLRFEYFDEFGNPIGQTQGLNTSITTRNDFLGAEDFFGFSATSIEGLDPFYRMDLQFLGDENSFSFLELDQFDGPLLQGMSFITASIVTLGDGEPFSRMTFIPQRGTFTFDVSKVPVPAGLPLMLTAAGTFAMLRWRRRRDRHSSDRN